jgi:uncharacterized protein YegL
VTVSTETSDFGDESVIAEAQPNLDTSRRRLVIIMIDLSGSMGVPQGRVRPVDALNARLATWVPDMRSQGTSSLREVEFAVVTFNGSGVGLLLPAGLTVIDDPTTPDWPDPGDRAFVPAAELPALRFDDATGMTPLAGALRAALALGDQRARRLAERGLISGAVRILLFTDGGSNDLAMPDGEWESIVDEVHHRMEKHVIQIFAFGVPGADRQRLTGLVGKEDGYVELDGYDFASLLKLITMATTAADPYEGIRGLMNEDR